MNPLTKTSPVPPPGFLPQVQTTVLSVPMRSPFRFHMSDVMWHLSLCLTFLSQPGSPQSVFHSVANGRVSSPVDAEERSSYPIHVDNSEQESTPEAGYHRGVNCGHCASLCIVHVLLTAVGRPTCSDENQSWGFGVAWCIQLAASEGLWAVAIIRNSGNSRQGMLVALTESFKMRHFDFISLPFLRVSDLPLEICEAYMRLLLQ